MRHAVVCLAETLAKRREGGTVATMNSQVAAALIAGAVTLISVIFPLLVARWGFQATIGATNITASQADRVLREQHVQTLNARFATAAEELGSDKPAAVRLAGVYAMAGLADDWEDNRQICIDVLCAYLRMPYLPDPGAGQARLTFLADREVRHTVIRVVTEHLKEGAEPSWQGRRFDFTGAVFDGGDFEDAIFSGSTVNFDNAKFTGGEVNFINAKFASGGISFIGAEFTGGMVWFIGAEFTGSTVNFGHAEFTGSAVNFDSARFCSGSVHFNSATFSRGSTVSFDDAEFSGSWVDFRGATLTGGIVDFNKAAKWSDPPWFDRAGTPPAGVKLPAAAGGQVRGYL
jgi:hypothetical protein